MKRGSQSGAWEHSSYQPYPGYHEMSNPPLLQGSWGIPTSDLSFCSEGERVVMGSRLEASTGPLPESSKLSAPSLSSQTTHKLQVPSEKWHPCGGNCSGSIPSLV